MVISRKVWTAYTDALRKISEEATKRAWDYVTTHNVFTPEGTDALIAFCYGLATKYGEAAGTLAAELYDTLALAENAAVAPAIPAATATMDETAKTVVGTLKTGNNEIVSSAVGRLVKTAGVDTTIQNAIRDGAEFAWIPQGDTCPFCLTLASRDWHPASEKALKNGHAEHIHANCDCTYAVRFDGKSTVEGYRPKEYLSMYKEAPLDQWNTPDGKPPAGHEGAEKRTPRNLINAMRRQQYAENREAIRAQQNAAYAARKGREE